VQVGLHALGIGDGARPEIIRAVAVAAEAGGFATLWSGEHVVLVDRPASRYPYAADGKIAVAADADWIDPLLGLSFIAAVTRRIQLATGVLLLPEHNPLHAATGLPAPPIRAAASWPPAASREPRNTSKPRPVS
jgi:alkanesulfonate monooxygenase SsuD/methylene tetrahydromethanopterin reductase-like flavin-dependent oxidoreductase (luciferase family)